MMQELRNRLRPDVIAEQLPALLFAAYVLLSYPMMLPGLDVYIHLARIDAGTDGSWALFWHHLFGVLQVEHALTRALIIHRVQTAAAGILLYAAATLLLRLVFAPLRTEPALIRLGAWCSVLVWLLMHGTVSRPIGGTARIWQAWLQWYSVNYQIALPLAVFAVAALLAGLLTPDVSRRRRLAYLVASATAACAVAVIHAAEVPNILFGLALAGIVFFRRAWWRGYLIALVLGLVLLLFGLEQSYRLPTGFTVLRDGGVAALRDEMTAVGARLVTGLNRGNAGWNLWFWANLGLALAALRLLWPQLNGQSRRMLLFIVLSALPAAGLYLGWTAGFAAMVTYPRLAWRFVFTSLLFLAPALLLIGIVRTVRPQRAPLLLSGLFVLLVSALMLVSYTYEPQRVSLRYARSMLLALNPQAMAFSLPPHEEAWLAELQEHLERRPPAQPLCTDTQTAYRLYFLRGYRAVVLPERVADVIRPSPPPVACDFPRDGGPVVRQLPIGPPPWAD